MSEKRLRAFHDVADEWWRVAKAKADAARADGDTDRAEAWSIITAQAANMIDKFADALKARDDGRAAVAAEWRRRR